jgi:hypothetical protein
MTLLEERASEQDIIVITQVQNIKQDIGLVSFGKKEELLHR